MDEELLAQKASDRNVFENFVYFAGTRLISKLDRQLRTALTVSQPRSTWTTVDRDDRVANSIVYALRSDRDSIDSNKFHCEVTDDEVWVRIRASYTKHLSDTFSVEAYIEEYMGNTGNNTIIDTLTKSITEDRFGPYMMSLWEVGESDLTLRRIGEMSVEVEVRVEVVFDIEMLPCIS
jgi:hypothetical protein